MINRRSFFGTLAAGLFDRFTAEHAVAVLVYSTPFLFAHRTRLADLALQHGLPTAFEFREYVDAGGLLSYGPSVPGILRRGAMFVDRILKGNNAGDLPVEQPTQFELVINLKTATALGLTIPPSLVVRADQVIE